jgi:hypothetical protein
MSELNVLNETTDSPLNPDYPLLEIDPPENWAVFQPRAGTQPWARQVDGKPRKFQLTWSARLQDDIDALRQWAHQYRGRFFSLYDGERHRYYSGGFITPIAQFATGAYNQVSAAAVFQEYAGCALFEYPNNWDRDAILIYPRDDSAQDVIKKTFGRVDLRSERAREESGFDFTNTNLNGTDAAEFQYWGYGFRVWARKDVNLGIAQISCTDLSGNVELAATNIDFYAAAPAAAAVLLTKDEPEARLAPHQAARDEHEERRLGREDRAVGHHRGDEVMVEPNTRRSGQGFRLHACGGPVDGQSDYVLRGHVKKEFQPAADGEGVETLSLRAECTGCARGKLPAGSRWGTDDAAHHARGHRERLPPARRHRRHRAARRADARRHDLLLLRGAGRLPHARRRRRERRLPALRRAGDDAAAHAHAALEPRHHRAAERERQLHRARHGERDREPRVRGRVLRAALLGHLPRRRARGVLGGFLSDQQGDETRVQLLAHHAARRRAGGRPRADVPVVCSWAPRFKLDPRCGSVGSAASCDGTFPACADATRAATERFNGIPVPPPLPLVKIADQSPRIPDLIPGPSQRVKVWTQVTHADGDQAARDLQGALGGYWPLAYGRHVVRGNLMLQYEYTDATFGAKTRIAWIGIGEGEWDGSTASG